MSELIEYTIDGISCYGNAGIGQNYEISFDDEIRDFIATDIEAKTWAGVLRVLQPLDGIQQIIAV